MASGLQVLASQVAGHTADDGASNPMMAGNGKIYKPLQTGSRGNRELEFYNTIPTLAPQFVEFIPKCYGTQTITLDGNEVSYLVLEDLTQGIAHETLCIADIKMSNVTYDYFASEKKIAEQVAKCRGTTTVSHAFRFCGMRVYQGPDQGIVKYDKKWGKNLAGDKITDAVRTFMWNKSHLISQVIDKLKAILEWFEGNTSLNFVGTSLLIIYDGNPALAGADPENVTVKIIDFAHVCKTRVDGEKDSGYILGLKNLLQAFEEVHLSS